MLLVILFWVIYNFELKFIIEACTSDSHVVKDIGAVFCALQTNGKRDFEVGDELRVKCSSFSSKGIPVVSTAEDD